MAPESRSPESIAGRQAFELVCCCARTQVLPEHAERAEALVREGVAWGLVNRLAVLHGVHALVDRALLAVCPEALPDALAGELHQRTRATAVFNTLLASELGRLLGRLDARALPALALKGPALAQMAYGDVRLRVYLDLDVLVRGEDFRAVKSVLAEEGYAPRAARAGSHGLRTKISLWQARQYVFTRGAGVFNLDLHTAVMPPLYYYAMDFDALWSRAEAVRVGEAAVQCCGPEDTLLMLCFHGAKNRWETLKYVCDVAELIRARPGLDWDRVRRQARTTRAERMLYLGLHLAHALLGAALPEEVAQRIERDRPVRQIGERLLERFPTQVYEGSVAWEERFRFHLAIQDTVATRVRYGSVALLRRLWDLVPPRNAAG
ncbi:MAG: nucleotidyltransferase family protein [Rhodothermales bacterium]|nr:nucleotidyltransferase family protein [Rhodothermales bacterium]